MVKIIDKINASIARQQTFFSLEFFPPKTDAGVENLYVNFPMYHRICNTVLNVQISSNGPHDFIWPDLR